MAGCLHVEVEWYCLGQNNPLGRGLGEEVEPLGLGQHVQLVQLVQLREQADLGMSPW